MYKKNYVFGEGEGEFMMVGEAPGELEDELGRPFVGRAGKLLDRLLEESGLKRKDFFITNVVKCRPPNNRNPKMDEVRACMFHLDMQVKLLSPKAILCLGRFAGMVMLDKDKPLKIKDFRGKILISKYGVPCIVTYHPASVFRNPKLYDYILEDMLLFRKNMTT